MSRDKRFIRMMFDEISQTYDFLNRLLSGMQDRRWRKLAVNYLKSSKNNYETVLDLASGSGDLALEFLSLNPGTIISADLSLKMLSINRKKNISRKNFAVQADAEQLPFQDSYFDLTGIAFGIRNFESPGLCIDEIRRVLKNGGLFLTIEFFNSTGRGLPMKLFDFYFKKIVPLAGNLISRSSYAYNYLFESVDNFLSVEEYLLMLSEKGFKVESSKNNFMGVVNTVIARKNC